MHFQKTCYCSQHSASSGCPRCTAPGWKLDHNRTLTSFWWHSRCPSHQCLDWTPRLLVCSQKLDDVTFAKLKLVKVILLPANIKSKSDTLAVSKWSSAWLKTEVTANILVIYRADAEGVQRWEEWPSKCMRLGPLSHMCRSFRVVDWNSFDIWENERSPFNQTVMIQFKGQVCYLWNIWHAQR